MSVVRRSGKSKAEVRRAQRQITESLNSTQGLYCADRMQCDTKEWITPCDDSNTVRMHFLLWRNGSQVVDFVVNVQVLASSGWVTVEYFDCCHGHCHLHPKNGEDPVTIERLDHEGDVRRAFEKVIAEADDRARIIRDEGGGW